MKKYLLTLLIALFGISCSGGNDPLSEPTDPTDPTEPLGDQKVLVIYYTRTGNTKQIANFIHATVECDIVELETVEPYPEAYNDILTQAQNELNSGYRPALKTTIEDIGKYDVIIIGHPIWHGHVPPPVQSLLAGYDFSGKKIAPFCTHGGSGVAQSRSDISRLCPNSTLLESLAVSGSTAGNAKDNVTNWLRKIGIIQADN
ncbi:MAG: NAD(P)H-dependent oxidoreductase [Bacteroidales bacterium]|jgi:flavodoxin|nr:NAD(P)H-dependent oxidoreductase [Bacteroidales bacterium]